MEIGESISMPQLPDPVMEEGCPFDHDKPPADPTKNELGGEGGKLGHNMMATGQTIDTRVTGGAKTRDPRATVNIKVGDELKEVRLKGKPIHYPFTCAAHHLIPAQASLRDHPVLEFMCKDGESQDFRKSGKAAPKSVAGSRVWANLGYNVNGCENGLWLPGNYAVGGNGLGIWKATSRVTSDEKEEEELPPSGAHAAFVAAVAGADFRDYGLVGRNHIVDPDNPKPKWAYVKATMDKVHGQFHDSHKEYSMAVKDYLTAVAAAYRAKHKRYNGKEKCEQCKKANRPENAAEGLIAPPPGLLGQLQSCSDFFRGHLAPTGKLWMNIYTSKWVAKWFEPRLKTPRRRVRR